MANNIVQLNVSQTVAPAPSTLQGTGAFVTNGGTNTAANTLTTLTQLSDLTAIKGTAKTISAMTWLANVVTVTLTAAHGWPVGQSLSITIAGVTPTAYNGTYTCSITTTTAFTYALTPNPGSMTVAGTAILAAVAELTAMATTFFAQGSTVAVQVLELGATDVSHGVTNLSTYLTTNPKTIYSLLMPRAYDGDSGFEALLAEYLAPNAMQYFFVTTTTGNFADYADMKCVVAMVEAPATPSTEFSLAAEFWVTLSYAPSTTNQVTPLAFAYLYGVTAYPTVGNSSVLNTLKAGNVNYVGTGAEGGISNKCVFWGRTMDGNPFNYWYAVDWFQINVDIDLANEVINGSNNPLAPLYYNQNGIDRLQARAQATADRGVSFGLLLGPVTVEAVSFITWTTENPSDYATGTYGGLSATITAARGFESITVDINVTDFPSA